MASAPNTRQEGSRRLHILLGVTGSVAAVKAPEIACRFIEEFDGDDYCCEVKVLLSAGGLNFWEKSAEYDNKSWKKLQEQYLGEQKPRIQIICTLRKLYSSLLPAFLPHSKPISIFLPF
jgi:hypothetical protein